MSEAECEFVSSRGILKSMDVHSLKPVSSITSCINYGIRADPTKKYASVHVCGRALPDFCRRILPRLPRPFVLVTGDCDPSPNEVCTAGLIKSLLADKRLIHWYSQNWNPGHPKVTTLPIGLDYHTLAAHQHHSWGPQTPPLNQERLLKAVASKAKHFSEREIKCYASFHFAWKSRRYGLERRAAIAKVPEELVFYEPQKVVRLRSWSNQARYAFVLSPPGGGLDCHRTWEALALGCIPILKRSSIAPLFEGLPVLFVDDWDELTKDLLEKTVADLKHHSERPPRLTLNYWVKRINSH